MLWALADPLLNAGIGSAGTWGQPWPHVQQVCRVERHRVTCRTGAVQREVSFAVTSRSAQRADAARLLAGLRGHWGIENQVHWVRDVTYDEDRCTVRTGAAPQVGAACRNLAITLVRRAGATNIAAACRTYAGRPHTAIALVATTTLTVVK